MTKAILAMFQVRTFVLSKNYKNRYVVLQNFSLVLHNPNSLSLSVCVFFLIIVSLPKAHAKGEEFVFAWKKVVEMSTERLIASGVVQSEGVMPRSHSARQCGEAVWIFEELPKATILSVSRPETGDISPMLLSYTIEFQYKQASTNSISIYLFGSLSIWFFLL